MPQELAIYTENTESGRLPPDFHRVSWKPDVLCEGTQCAEGSDGNVYDSVATRKQRIELTRYEKRYPTAHPLFDVKLGAIETVNCPSLLPGKRCGLFKSEPLPSGVKVPTPRCYRFPEVTTISR